MGAAGQFPRVYWFPRDLGHPSGTGGGWRYADSVTAAPAGDSISVVNLAQPPNGGDAWTGLIRGFSLYPNSSRIGGIDIQREEILCGTRFQQLS
jgi:hypothetical protein